MAVLSALQEGSKGASIIASPIYILADQSGPRRVVFEVLTKDAGRLFERAGKLRAYVIDHVAFWGRLERLDEVHPVHPTTVAMDLPTLRGEILRLSSLSDSEIAH
jgi:hypothetical protein